MAHALVVFLFCMTLEARNIHDGRRGKEKANADCKGRKVLETVARASIDLRDIELRNLEFKFVDVADFCCDRENRCTLG